MADPVFGIVFRKQEIDARPAIAADMSTIGLIGPAPQADATLFPLNTPVKIYSNDIPKLKKLGEAGFVADAIRGINDQLAELQRAAQVIFVRTPEGVSVDSALKNQQTIANIMGSSTQGTGLWSFMFAPEMVGASPRILIAPGYTGLLATGVDEVTQSLAGTNYVEGQTYTLTFTGGGSDAVQATGHAIGQTDGTLGPAIIDTPGAWYTAPPTVTAPAPTTGTTATFTAVTATLANPIVATMPAIATQLLAHGIAESAGTTQQQDEDYRETINSDRIIPIVGGVKITDPVTGNTLTRPLAPRVAGLLVRRDHQTGGAFHSAANQAVTGIIGPARSIRFAITHLENEGQALLAANMGILVKGEIGSDFAIASGGYIFIGTDNAGEDELWRFYNQTRGRDFIHLTLLRAMRFYLGRFNVTAHVITAICNMVKNVLRDLQAKESIIGFHVDFRGLDNSADEIRQGHIVIAFAAEEPAPLRKITTLSSRYRPAVDRMVAQLESQLNLAA